MGSLLNHDKKKNSPSVGDMEEGTYMEKAIWTWRESRGSAKLTFGFNLIVLFTVFQLFIRAQ